MKIHIMGASCAGSTTLGKALAETWQYAYFDTDEYFWLSSDIPYTVKRSFEERNRLLKEDLQQHQHVIVGGSLVNWGPEWKTFFDLVVFLYIPHHIRMQRLSAREQVRYGSALTEDPVRAEIYKKFQAWAAGYDDNSTQGRNLVTHQTWLQSQTGAILEISGDTSVEERVNLINKRIGKYEIL